MKTVHAAPPTLADAAPGPDKAGPAHRTNWRQSGRLARVSVTALVITLTLLALWVRVDGLQGWDGTLSVDEARLALAARGIVEHGVPRLPSGWVYTRGLLATYLTAPAFMVLGESDFVARLPAVLAGAALIPVAYLLGREVAGRLGGLFVAAFLAGHPSFVVWSRQAWFYALYVLLFGIALLFILRAQRTGRAADQILAGSFVGLSAFAHEVGIFLLAPLAVQAATSLWRRRPGGQGVAAPLASLAIVGLAALVLWLLVTRLRAESLVGAYGEIEEYLSPAAEWPRVAFYLRMLLDGPGLLLAAALLGLPLALARHRGTTAILWLALLPSLLHAAFLIPRGPQERYGLTLVLVMAVLAAEGACLLGEALTAWLRRSRSLGALTPTLLTGVLLLGMLAAHQNVAHAIQRAALSPRDGVLIRQARELGLGPGDTVMTDVPTVVEWYIGGLDYWAASRDYEKYTTRDGDVRRDVHSGAVLVRSRGDLERVVREPGATGEIWLLASGRNYQWGELVSDDLKAMLDRLAITRLNPGGSARILLIGRSTGS